MAQDGQKNYITPTGLKRLKDEYTDLMHKERPKVVETVTWAASNGDLSENADYHYGKRRLAEIDARVKYLLDRLDAAVIVDPTQVQSETVLFGATVTFTNEEGDDVTYQIVGEDEVDTKACKISWKSPVGKALLGKKVDEVTMILKPAGSEEVVIGKIEYK